MVRSAIYEMLLAYQQFLTAWSTQFDTPFTFTFMPEIYPGGKVAFPGHGLQMYVQEVVHSWDYAESGFTTVATLSCPAIYGNSNPDLPPYMVRAMVEPVASVAETADEAGATKQATHQAKQAAHTGIAGVARTAIGAVGGLF
jgi:hypothetical protein